MNRFSQFFRKLFPSKKADAPKEQHFTVPAPEPKKPIHKVLRRMRHSAKPKARFRSYKFRRDTRTGGMDYARDEAYKRLMKRNGEEFTK